MIVSVRSREDAESTAERVLSAIHNMCLPHGYSPVDACVTVSIGGYFDTPDSDVDVGADVRRFLSRADQALYRAKSDGRNCIRFPE